jgi:hypothetical protein
VFSCRPGGDIKSNGEKFGLKDLTWTVLRRVSDEVHKELKDKVKKYNLSHWNKTPCTTSTRHQGFVSYKVQADYQFMRNDLGPDGRKIPVKGPSGTWDYGTVDVPKGDLQDGTTRVRCRCSVVSDNLDNEETGLVIEEDGKKEFATAQKTEESLSIDCPSMNECILTCSGTVASDCRMTIGPGTVLRCVDGSCQDEVVTEGVSFMCGPNVQVSLHTRPLEQSAGTRASAACLNMHKAEPRSGVKYVFALPSKGSAVQLARKTASERVRGSWDQIRLWIVTDHASHDDIVKVLFPRPGPGVYLQSLYDVAILTGLDVTSSEYKDCLDPGLIIGSVASREATEWYVDLWAKREPKALATWLNQHKDDFTSTCFSANATEGQIAHGADAFNALCSSGNPLLAEAGLMGLEKIVPSDKRGQLAASHGLEGALGLLAGGDTKLAEHALKVAELYRDPASAHLLLNASDEGIRARAAKLFSEIGKG